MLKKGWTNDHYYYYYYKHEIEAEIIKWIRKKIKVIFKIKSFKKNIFIKMSLSRQCSFSTVSSVSDYEDDCFYPIWKLHGDYRDESYYYDGISDEELHSLLNREFEEKVDWEIYDIGFCEEDLLYDDGGAYILYNSDNECQLVHTEDYGDFSGDEEGVYQLGEYDFVAKKYIKLKPKSALDSMIKIFNM